MKKYFQAPWDLKDLLFILFITLALSAISAFLLHYFQLRQYLEFYPAFLAQWIILLIPLICVTSYKYKLKWKHFSFNKVKASKAIWLVVKSLIIYFLLSFVLLSVIIYSGLKIPGYQIQESIVPHFGSDILSLVLATITVAIIAPILEEVFFRGFLLQTISNRTGIVWGSIISALIFAALHTPWGSFIPIFILGLIMNSLVIQARSIIPSIGFHIVNNLLAFTVQILLAKEIISLDKLV